MKWQTQLPVACCDWQALDGDRLPTLYLRFVSAQMSSDDLHSWVSDQLSALLSFTDSALTEFVTALASSSATPAALFSRLQEAGVPPSDAGKRFTLDLFKRAPRRMAASVAPRAAPTNADLLRASQRYAFVGEDELPPAAPAPSRTAAPAAAPAEKQRQARRRDGGDSSEDEVLRPDAKRARESNAVRHLRDAEGGGAVEDTARDADQRDRAGFEARLAARDVTTAAAAVTAPVADPAKAAAARLIDLEGADKERALEDARRASRRAYLEKRETRELTLLADAVRIEEEVFGVANLSMAERAQLEINKQILRIAGRDAGRSVEGETQQRYHMPGVAVDDEGDDADGGARRPRTEAAKREAALKARYREEVRPMSEQELWEASKISAAGGARRLGGHGAAAASGAAPVTQYGGGAGGGGAGAGLGGVPAVAQVGTVEYDFVTESTIEFVADELARGTTFDDAIEKKARIDSAAAAEVAAAGAAAAAAAAASTPESTLAALQAVRKTLPAFKYRDELLAAIREHQVLIVVGETGSGKTTQVPQYLHEIGYTKLGRIGCTQPRRVAAMSVAARVAAEMGVKLGAEVGYSIRFEDCTSDETIIKYMTDGMLLREFLTEPDLASYSVMIIDEAHERTLHTDIILGLIKDVARFRPDIKVIISSATVDADKFSSYFDDAPVFIIPGRRFAVDKYFCAAPEADYVQAAVVTALQIHCTQPAPGDILIFLTGQEDIEAAAEAIATRTRGLGTRVKELVVCPVYANLPSDAQAKIFDPAPPGGRKVVIATNIAETSLTIEGIVYVIDCGYVKQNSFNARTGMETLAVVAVSKASAEQRAGRAGRTGPGKCMRLFTKSAYESELPDETPPEILRVNLASVVLMLKSLGIDDMVTFDFMTKPPKDALMRALEQLYAIGALNDRSELTTLGRRMAEFPCDPQLSKTIICAEKYGCAEEVVSVAAMLDAGNAVFYRPKGKEQLADAARAAFARGGGGDHYALLCVYDSWKESGYSMAWCFENFVQYKTMKRARDVRDQLAALCERVEVKMESSGGDADAIAQAFTAGYFYNAAKLDRSGGYVTVKNGYSVHMHPSSCLAKQEVPVRWVIYHELVETTKEYMRQVITIKSEWLAKVAPHVFNSSMLADNGKKERKAADADIAPGQQPE